jgi:CheY-like chemotaxis protein
MLMTPLQVLVVEDDVDAAESMAALLELEGHATEIAHAGPEALDAARRVKPDLVLIDLGLPGLDGCSVAAQIRREPTFDRTLLVALTGWGREADKVAALDAGFDLHLLKPVGWNELREVLARAEPGQRSA